jgi:hypothetical protein
MAEVATRSGGLMKLVYEGGSERDNQGGSCCGMMEVGNEAVSSGDLAKGIMKEVAVVD